MGEDSEAEVVRLSPEPGLAEVDARAVGRCEIAASLASYFRERVAENESAVERVREKIPQRCLDIEAACPAEEVVMGESPVDLEELDRVESSADSRLSERSFNDVHYQHL